MLAKCQLNVNEYPIVTYMYSTYLLHKVLVSQVISRP